jgi:hexosaminidase
MYNTIIRPYYEDSTTFKIELDTELKDLDIYYTFDNTDPDIFSPKYEGPLSVPRDATWLRTITYRNENPVGKMISLKMDELKQKAKK